MSIKHYSRIQILFHSRRSTQSEFSNTGQTVDVGIPEDVKSPNIDSKDVAGKSPEEIDKLACQKSLTPKGSNPMNGKGSYTDPVTGQQRVLIHPESNSGPHSHVNNSSGQRLDINGRVVTPESPEAHLPLKLP